MGSLSVFLRRWFLSVFVWTLILPMTASESSAQTGLQFNGSSQYVTFGAATSTLGAQSFTLECWFKRTAAGVATTTGGTGAGGGISAFPLVTKGRGEADGSTVDANYFLGINSGTSGYPGAANVLTADFEEGTGTTNPGLNHPVCGVTPIINNVWYHAAVTYDAPNLRWRLYLNGVVEKDTVIAAGTRFPQYLSTQHAGLGTAMTSTGAPAGFFAGVIDEVRIWNLARTQMQIQESINSEVTSGTGLLGRWGLNDGSGLTAANSVPGSPAGTLTPSTPVFTWVTPGAPFNITFPTYGLQFNGSSQYVTSGVTPSNSPLNTPTFTVETWFRRDGTGASVSTGTGGITAIPLVTKGTSEGETAPADINYFLGINTTGNVLCADFEEAQTGLNPSLNHPVSGSTTIVNGVWYHAAVTYNGSKWQLLLNGNLEAELVVGQPPNSAVLSPFAMATSIRSNGTTIQGYFNGVLDEVRLWNYARTQQQIRDNMSAEITSGTGLQGRWGLNESSGTTATNSVAGNPNGTLVGTPTRFSMPTVPTAPSALAATVVSSSQINLSWTDNSGSIEAAFEVQRSTDGGSAFATIVITGMNTTSYNDTGLTASTQYWYRVRAINPNQASAYASVATATTITPPPPEAPGGLTATATSAYEINLGWTDNSNNEASFEVWRSADGGSNFTLRASTASNAVSYADTLVNSNAQYFYRVRAVNSGGNSVFTADANATTATEGSTALQFGSSNAYVTLGQATTTLGAQSLTIECWFKRIGLGAGTSTGGGGVPDLIPLVSKGRGESETGNLNTNYALGISLGSNTLVADFEEGTGSQNPALNHPIVGTTTIVNNSWYHAAATYDKATGVFSLYLNGTLEASIDLADNVVWPENLSIQHAALGTALTSTAAAAGFFDGVIDEARIWNYARTVSELAGTINSQIITPQTGLLGRWGMNEGSGTKVHGNAGAFVNGTVVGTGSSWPAGAPFNIGPPTPPTAPSSLTATASSPYRIDLSWIDNSSTETNSEIERSTTGIGGTYSLLATVGANTTLYSDATVNSSSEYCYRVRATNGAGASSYADPSCATTPAEGDYALDLGSNSAYATFGEGSALGAQSFTLECWFKRTGTSALTTTGTSGVLAIPLITKGMAESDGSTLDMNYFLGINSTTYVVDRSYGPPNVLVADLEEGTGSASPGLNHPVAGITPITNGVWYHAAVTYDVTGRRWRLYLNGSLEKDTVISAGTCLPQFNSIQHAALGSALVSSGLPGSSAGYGPGYFNGVIDEARIWNYARSSADIMATINSQIIAAPSGLIGRWGLNEGTGTTIHGNAGSFVDGTITGTGSNWVTPGAPFNYYELSIMTTNGTVVKSPDQTMYASGTVVTLTPAADPGYHFVNWTGDVLSGHETDNPLLLTIDGNKAITANFTLNTYVYVKNSVSLSSPGVIYANSAMKATVTPPPYNDPDDWSITGVEQVSAYIVPQVGAQFGACELTLQWDQNVLSFTEVDFGTIGPPNGLFGSGHGYTPVVSFTPPSPTNSVTINCSTTEKGNFVTNAGDYIAKVNFTLVKPVHSAIGFSSSFSIYNGGSTTSVPIVPVSGDVRAYLGDVASVGSTSTGDGLIDNQDLFAWSLSYWSGTGISNYKVKYDIGPTQDNSISSLPAPSRPLEINFEDLMIFSIGYNLSANNLLPKVPPQGDKPVRVYAGAPRLVGNETYVPVQVSGPIPDIRGMSLVLNGRFGKLLGAEKGTLLSGYTTPVMVMAKSEGSTVFVDLAVMGLDAKGLSSEGEVAVLRFEGDANVSIAKAECRNSVNKTLNVNVVDGAKQLPTTFGLEQNYPNPFNPVTTLEYRLPVTSRVEIVVYNILGERITTLVDEVKEAGYYSVQWTGTDDAGRQVASGIYFYSVRAGDFRSIKKMVLLK